MAADSEVSDMAVDSNGSETARRPARLPLQGKRQKTQEQLSERREGERDGRQVPFRTVTWNLAGLAEDSLEP